MRDLISLMENYIAEWGDEDEDDLDGEGHWGDDDEAEDEHDDPTEYRTNGYDFGRLGNFYHQVVAAADSQMDSGSEIEFSDVQNWVEHHAELFQQGTITVFRTMRLQHGVVEALKAGTELGSHWTYEFDESALDAFDINGQDGGTLYTFAATIHTGQVAFPLTVAYNCLFPEEKEIYPFGHASLTLIGIYETEDMENPQRVNLRPDLVGKEFPI
jgi:hypothetical protein